MFPATGLHLPQFLRFAQFHNVVEGFIRIFGRKKKAITAQIEIASLDDSFFIHVKSECEKSDAIILRNIFEQNIALTEFCVEVRKIQHPGHIVFFFVWHCSTGNRSIAKMRQGLNDLALVFAAEHQVRAGVYQLVMIDVGFASKNGLRRLRHFLSGQDLAWRCLDNLFFWFPIEEKVKMACCRAFCVRLEFGLDAFFFLQVEIADRCGHVCLIIVMTSGCAIFISLSLKTSTNPSKRLILVHFSLITSVSHKQIKR